MARQLKIASAGYVLPVTGLDFAAARLVPVTGTGGWLARIPGAVLWVPDGSAGSQQFISSCVAADGPAGLLARLGRCLADPSAKQWPAFAVLADRQGELVVLVHGPADVTVDYAGGSQVLRGGEDTGSWVSRVLRGAQKLTAGPPTARAVEAGPDDGEGGGSLANLALGVLRADGFVLQLVSSDGSDGAGPGSLGHLGRSTDPSGRTDLSGRTEDVPVQGTAQTEQRAPSAEQAMSPARGATAMDQEKVDQEQTVLVGEMGPTEGPDAQSETVPPGPAAAQEGPGNLSWASRAVMEAASAAEEATLVEGAGGLGAVTLVETARTANGAAAGASTVRGAYCPNGHFDDPRSPSCRRCGAQIDRDAPQVEAPRPPLGSLNWDDGEVTPLGQGALVGRDVAGDKAVVGGRLRALVPRGVNDSMSRVHAELNASGWDVTVTDRGSTNGTFVWEEAGRVWRRLVPGEAQLVVPGTVLAFGERTATFEL